MFLFLVKALFAVHAEQKVKLGKVTMDANYALSDQEVKDGYILTCQLILIVKR